MIVKREILGQLDCAELLEAADRLGIDLPDRRDKDGIA